MPKTPLDLATTLLRKADSDLRSARLLLDAGEIDTACFHIEQAAEKYLKAVLANEAVLYPFTHDLGDLLGLAVGRFPVLAEFADSLPHLSDFAVSIRYDDSGLPSHGDAIQALETVARLRARVATLMPRRVIQHNHDDDP